MPHIALKKTSATWSKRRHKFVIVPFLLVQENSSIIYIYIQLRISLQNYHFSFKEFLKKKMGILNF